MLSKKRRNFIFLEAAILTFLVYFFAIIVNGYLDDARIDVIEKGVYNSSIKSNSIVVFNNFQESFNYSKCDIQKDFILENFMSLKEVGSDFTDYGSLFSEKNKNFTLNKQREYFLDQLSLLRIVYGYNEGCSQDIIVPIIYFYNSLSSDFDRQGLILEQFSLYHKNETIIFSFDINYKNEPILEDIKGNYEITSAPFLIIGNKTTRDFTKGSIVEVSALTIEYKKIRGEN